jgi:hypothetical protein
MKNAVFWYVMPPGYCKSRRFGAKYHFHQGENNQRARNSATVISNRCTFADSCHLDHRGDTFLRNVGLQKPDCVTSQKTGFVILEHIQEEEKSRLPVGYRVVTELTMKHIIFWDVTPYIISDRYCFGLICCLCLQGRRDLMFCPQDI